MYKYAISIGCFGELTSPKMADAFRRSKFNLMELSFHPPVEPNKPDQVIITKLQRQLVKEGIVKPASVHMPFYGNDLSWDPSEPDEEKRKEIIGRFIRLIKENADLMGPNATFHASNEPPLEEHPKRIEQVRRSIEDLLPLAEKLKFSINIEYLPRTCVGRSAEELQKIVAGFDDKYVGICMDVNHTMNLNKELPDIITELSPRIHSFHISDYDGIDELHWMPGQGLIDWCEVMKRIRAIDHDVLLILETDFQLKSRYNHPVDPIYSLRQLERSAWFMENCDELVPRINDFKIPGNC